MIAVDTGIDADTLDKLLIEHRLDRPPQRRYDLPAGSTVVVDEAAMVPTPRLAELIDLADRRGWRLALIYDPMQFAAVGRSGMFGHLVDTIGAWSSTGSTASTRHGNETPASDFAVETPTSSPSSHLHAFEIGGDRYGMQFDEYPDGELQEKDFTVVTAVGANESFTYDYDFGDSWVHEITVHRVWRMPRGLKFAVCLEGANACPPEDAGGSWGYEHLLAVLADPSHEEHEHLSRWVGRPVDPHEFDLALVNAHLQAVR